MAMMIDLTNAVQAIKNDEVDSLNWSAWSKMPKPDDCRLIGAPLTAGLYQIRNSSTKENIQFGIGKRCQERMQSLYPKPYGQGTRNNSSKREFILENWRILEFRTLATADRHVAEIIENFIKSKKNHLFNT